MALKTDYQDAVLDAETNEYRVFDIVDSQGNVVQANVHLEEKTVYSRVGDDYGATDINEQNTFINGLKDSFSQALTDLKATAIAQAVGALVSDTFAQVITKLSAIIDRGAVTQTINPGGSYTIPRGYHNGSGKVTANPNQNSTTATITTTYTSGNGKDLGANNTVRYIKTSGLMVTPTATKSITANGNNQDVLNYAKVNVSVPTFNIQTPAVLVGTLSFTAVKGAWYVVTVDMILGSNQSFYATLAGGATVKAYSSGTYGNVGSGIRSWQQCWVLEASGTTVSWSSNQETTYCNMIVCRIK